MTERQRWSSKMIFLFAAIGSAVGLGNVWRFPYLAGKYGGGSFLIPYVIILLIMGIPLLIMEFAIGQKMQLGAVRSFGKIHRKLAGIGVGAVLCGFVVVSYYAVVMAWSLIYFFHSFTMRWGTDTEHFFKSEVINLIKVNEGIGYISPAIIFALVVVWAMIYFSVWKGVKSVGKVVLITMPLPVILLIILLIRGITLPGALEGIIFYLKPNFTALLDPKLWGAAMSQIFFTLSLAFGIMIAYASYQHHTSDIAKSAVITSVTNSAVSIIAGFAVFSTLGYMSSQSGVPVSELAAEGPSLAFIVFPKALSLIPLAPVFAVLFFLMLITLGIDSAFSLVEAVSTVVHDNYPHVRKEDVSFYVCALGFICGIIFTTFAGLYYLDITDHFITNYGLVFIGLLEVWAIGWLYGAEKLRKYINDVSDIKIGKWWSVFIKFVIPVCLLIFLISTLKGDIKNPYGGYSQRMIFACGWLVLAGVLLISYLVAHFSKEE